MLYEWRSLIGIFYHCNVERCGVSIGSSIAEIFEAVSDRAKKIAREMDARRRKGEAGRGRQRRESR
jgi:hypothetical protein